MAMGVFGGLSSYTSGRNSFTEFRPNKLGSMESDNDYGGEEGAKPFGRLRNSSASQRKSYSEGRMEEENVRPDWQSELDDLPEVIHFFKASPSDHSSSSVYQHCLKQSPSVSLESSVHHHASSFQDKGVIINPP